MMPARRGCAAARRLFWLRQHRAPSGQLMVHGRERVGPSATFNKDTPARATSLRKRVTIRARRGAGVRVVLMLVETFGGIGPAGRVGVYDETTFHVVGADVVWMAFTTRRLSVAVAALLGRAGARWLK